ncbi:ScbA/BarX family gamma-butyrolactone biosynthesis protein [Streptomyces sp. NPDC060031]|uniref:ScbA/BarX family gamma-butyrolactone biosynthesis protein n=1 Tax=Streptomyces sp. NPDC060031 TaxID=3347043 RepID=UPI0036886C01
MTTSTFRVERPTIDAHQVGSYYPDSFRRATDLRYPSLTTTVPREFVHRAAVAEVMLTDWEQVDDTRFRVAAQWPRSHSFFTPIDGEYHDPLMVTETVRQIGYLLAHAGFGVPIDHQFLLWNLTVTVHPEHLRVRQTPASLDIKVTCTDLKRRGNGDLAGLHYETEFRRDGQLVATGGATFTCTTPAAYRRVRGDHAFGANDPYALPLTAPAAPQSVGRTSPVDVVLSPVGEPNRWQLRVDTRHPVLFDHPVDHVPGMLLLESARQAAAGALGRSSILPLSITGDFRRYVELATPCTIDACLVPEQLPDGSELVLVTGHQDDVLCFSASLTVAPEDR